MHSLKPRLVSNLMAHVIERKLVLNLSDTDELFPDRISNTQPLGEVLLSEFKQS